jgi:hypothetical protein
MENVPELSQDDGRLSARSARSARAIHACTAGPGASARGRPGVPRQRHLAMRGDDARPRAGSTASAASRALARAARVGHPRAAALPSASSSVCPRPASAASGPTKAAACSCVHRARAGSREWRMGSRFARARRARPHAARATVSLSTYTDTHSSPPRPPPSRAPPAATGPSATRACAPHRVHSRLLRVPFARRRLARRRRPALAGLLCARGYYGAFVALATSATWLRSTATFAYGRAVAEDMRCAQAAAARARLGAGRASPVHEDEDGFVTSDRHARPSFSGCDAAPRAQHIRCVVRDYWLHPVGRDHSLHRVRRIRICVDLNIALRVLCLEPHEPPALSPNMIMILIVTLRSPCVEASTRALPPRGSRTMTTTSCVRRAGRREL